MPGQWMGSTRRANLPHNWDQIRQDVKARAKGQCERIKGSTGQRCTNPGRDCDHIIRPGDGGTDDLTNLEWLCIFHHRDKTSREGNTARAAGQAKTRRPRIKHPGLR